MKHAHRYLILVLGTITLMGFPGSAPRADDTEIYVGGNAGASTVRPNVVFIIDTSGSMDTQDVLQLNGTYDPATTYAGSGTVCNTSRVYWSSNGKPPSCNTSNYFNASANKCNDSAAALSSSGSGYYVGRLARYRTNGGGTWRTFNNNDNSSSVECEADTGLHGDGVNTSKLYAANGNNGGPWTATAADGVNWSSTGSTYTLYSANYLNWLNTPGVASYEKRLKVVQDAFANLMNSTSGINAALMRYSQNGSGGYFAEPMLELTWAWLSKVPAISIGVAGLMTGLFWIIERRMGADMARKARESTEQGESK